MGCTQCKSKKGNSPPTGCRNNGGCLSGGCNKMNVFDWLNNMDLPGGSSYNIIEVRFKNGRKEYFKNNKNLNLITGEEIVTDMPNGYHIGTVSLQGELVRLQIKKKSIKKEDIRQIYRKATPADLEKFEQARNREMPTLFRAREIISDLKLSMKLSDIEYIADNTKAVFYYSAEKRVDFRELIKLLAAEFKIRIEMKQINLRQEAGFLGGIGSCGRELCCSTWLSGFKNVGTAAARYQNLSLNPAKLTGQCGRLKCCLNYELDTYMDALKDIPEVQKPLLIAKGKAYLRKTDIFKKLMWFSYENNNVWEPISVVRVNEIIAMNADGNKPENLLPDGVSADSVSAFEHSPVSDLERLDRKFSKKRKKKKKRPVKTD